MRPDAGMDSPSRRSAGRVLLAAAVALLAVLGAVGGALAVGAVQNPLDRADRGSAAPTAAPGGAIWSDEFDGPAGSAPDESKWIRNIGGTGWGNDELQYYTDSTRNAALDGAGNLVITARMENPGDYDCHYGACRYTSARLLTFGTFSRTYGRFEARLKLPRGQGLWPAFWMLRDDIAATDWASSGEIDVMEYVGSEPDTAHGSLHGPGYTGSDGLNTRFKLPHGQTLADDFHVVALDWTPTAITWSIDGTPYGTKTPADAGDNEWVFDHPFFMIMNVAVGGTWPGSPDASTVFPQSMVVDYVRVFPDAKVAPLGGSPSSTA